LQRAIVVDEAGYGYSHGWIFVEDGAQTPKGSSPEICVRVHRQHISSRKEFDAVVDRGAVAKVRGNLRDPNGWPPQAHVLWGTVG
jgi:hypothetical protein